MNEKAEIREFVQALLARKGVLDSFWDTDSLLINGLLDSVDVLEIAAFLEERWGVDFSEREFDAGEFDTIDGIAGYLAGDAA